MINLLPLCLKTVTWHNRIFRFSQPIFLQPELNKESQQLYVVEEPRLTLYAYAQTREQLTQEIRTTWKFAATLTTPLMKSWLMVPRFILRTWAAANGSFG